MLSINIPVYNNDVVDLVKELSAQADICKIEYEIRIYDDCSDVAFKLANKIIADLPNVEYREMEYNLGRSAIRNKMGLEAKSEMLLFIDADSEIIKKDYLQSYIDNYKKGYVLCGGTTYHPQKPAKSEQLLRWTYGRKREAISAACRNGRKGFVITSNNFLIGKEVFHKVHFREEIKGYGHEDTMLGYDLFKNNYNILHIDNPVRHIGLENTRVFLLKTQRALENLEKISTCYLKEDQRFIKQVNFLNKYKKITTIFPAFFLRYFYFTFHRMLERNLLGNYPRLLFFDLYKLSYYSTIKSHR